MSNLIYTCQHCLCTENSDARPNGHSVYCPEHSLNLVFDQARQSTAERKSIFSVDATEFSNWREKQGWTNKKCHCGSTIVGSPFHSSWCPMYEGKP